MSGSRTTSRRRSARDTLIRLVPFLSLNPKRGYAVEEVDRCVEQKMRGLKLHLWNSLVDTRQAADLAAVRRVVERAAHHRLPVVAHILVGAVPNYGPDDTERFVREIIMPFDTLQISLAHLAGAGGFGAREQACFERLIAALRSRHAVRLTGLDGHGGDPHRDDTG